MKIKHSSNTVNHYEISEVRNPLLPVLSIRSDNLTDSWELKPHNHPEAQLIFSPKGTIICEVKKTIYLVPPQCAIWIPTNIEHSTRGAGNTSCYCLFVDTTKIMGLPEECTTLSVHPLLRELILFASNFNVKSTLSESEKKIIDVLVDQLKTTTKLEVSLPMPTESRLYSVTNELIKKPNSSLKLNEWALRVNMSERSFTRLVQHELGMSFGRWKQQLHIVIALQRISEGVSITTIALDLGYENASSFVTMFKKILSKPPLNYFNDLKKPPPKFIELN
ncbi:AraC family transcriptional regulator [Enterobacter mori]|uniref:AraC family transcriptional regulator n=1 Tax=Enterobacter mori TaxID=539813 RepID=UPI001CF6A8C5|nr:helix-turn-helix domain-containing protein [Enterobacter mori]UCT05961.1 helix-turn-helix transcriptional regulator [Enterobacter mori]